MPFQEIEHLAHNIWRYPQGLNPAISQPNIGIIRDNNRTILIDAGNSPRHARMIHGELAASGFPPVGVIIYTHHHWDHVFGALLFPSATIIAHELCAAQLKQMASRAWNPTMLRDEAVRHPQFQQRNNTILRLIEDWRDFRICQPHLTFSKRMALHLHNGSHLELHHVGGNHAPDSIVVGVPEMGVMFLGDCVYPPPLYENPIDPAPKNNEVLLADLLDEQYQIYVQGHGDPLSFASLSNKIAPETTSYFADDVL